MSQDQGKVLEIVCPCCRAVLWVDTAGGGVVRSEKAAKTKESLDDLLVKEKAKKDGFATKFEATAALERRKREKAKEAFEKALGKSED